MYPRNGLDAYRNTEAQSRTPLELVVMLYDGAIRFLGVAREAQGRGDINGRRVAVSKALAIISELQSTLNVKDGGAVAADLDNLYGYMTSRIMHAVMNNDAGALMEVERLLGTLRDGWNSIAIDPVAAAASATAPTR